MSEKSTNPVVFPSIAAHEVVLEFIKAGKISYAKDASALYSHMLDHYRSETKRLKSESETD